MISNSQLFWLTWFISFFSLTILVYIDKEQRKYRIPFVILNLFLAAIPAFLVTYGPPTLTLNLYQLELVQQMMTPHYQRNSLLIAGLTLIILVPYLILTKKKKGLQL